MNEETENLKLKDVFENTPLLTGRTEIETINKLNTGLVWNCAGIDFQRLDNLTANSPYEKLRNSSITRATGVPGGDAYLIVGVNGIKRILIKLFLR